MKSTAAGIMTTEFPTVLPETPLTDAIRIFRESSQQHSRRLLGIIVTDANRHLVGMISMYDILLYVRPKHIQVWGNMEDLDFAGVIDATGSRIKSILVGDIMAPDVITIGPNVDLFMVLDIMIKKHGIRVSLHLPGIVASWSRYDTGQHSS